MTVRLSWFRCDASRLLGALSVMKPDVGYLYTILLFRIYEIGGPIHDDEVMLSRRTGLSAKRVGSALAWLIAHGKIERLPDGRIDSATTHAEIAFREKTIQNAKTVGKEAAKRKQTFKAEKAQALQQNEAAAGDHQVSGRSPASLGAAKAPPTDIEVERKKELASLVPKKAAAERPPSETTRRSRISQEAQPSEADNEVARAAGLSADRAQTEWGKFRDHHAAKGSTMASWAAAWRNWIARVDEFQPRKSNGTSGKGSIVDAGRKLTERLVADRHERELRAGVRGEDGDEAVRFLPTLGRE